MLLNRSAEEALREMIDSAKHDRAFQQVSAAFSETGAQSWLRGDEPALHFAIGAFAPGAGRIVEIGSFEGASACFLAAGIKRRGSGLLTSVDPHLGGPPWLGMVPEQQTLKTFRSTLAACGVADYVESRLGDSLAVSATWPAEPIDAVFIDADHSFVGALRDFECFAPKVRTGGLVMFDDADDPALPELLELIEVVKTFEGVAHVETVDGVAVFRRTAAPAAYLLDDLRRRVERRGVFRPWDMSVFHEWSLPPHFGKSKTWKSRGYDIAYQLCFLARCGPGTYGFTTSTPSADRAFLSAVAADRQDGDVVEMSPPASGFRAVFCAPEEAAACAPALVAGGVLIARHDGPTDYEASIAVREKLLAAGLEGCGWEENVHWAVWRPHHLSGEAIMDYGVSHLDPPA